MRDEKDISLTLWKQSTVLIFAREIIGALIIAISICSRAAALPSPLRLSETLIMTVHCTKAVIATAL